MADTNVSAPAARKRRGWRRTIIWIAGAFILLLVLVYFVATSSAFFKGMILPKVSKALNAQVTVSDASISPFSRVVLHDLKIQTTGAEPLVSAPEVRLRYSLMDILGDHINVDEVVLSSPTLAVVENPDGTSNLDPILQSLRKPPEKPASPSTSKPPRLNVQKVALTDGTVRQVRLYQGGNRDVTEVSHLNVTIDDLQNGQSAKLALAADVKMNNNPPAPGASGSMEAKINGNLTLALTAELKPASIQGNTRLEVARAEGALAPVAALSAHLDCDITSTDIKQVALRFQHAETRLGELRISGPFNLEKLEGRFTVEVLNIDKNLLNIAGAANGVDFGPTTISSSNTIQLANAGNTIAASGQLSLGQFQLTRTNQTTPPLDLAAHYDVTVDRAANQALVRALTLNGTQKGNPLVRGELTSPMTVAWGNVTNAVGDSALNLVLTHLDLAQWLGVLSRPGLSVSSGSLDLTAHLTQKQLQHNVSGQLALTDFTGQLGSNNFRSFGATADLDIGLTGAQVKIQKLAGNLTQNSRPGGAFAVSGTYGRSDNTAQLTAKLTDFNQIGLGPWLEPMLADKKLVSVAVNANAAVQYDPKAASSIKAELQAANLVVNDPKGQFPATALGAKCQLDASLDKQVAEIRQFQLALTPTARATNAINLAGHLDMSQTNTVQGNLKLAADSLDLTSYYDLFVGQQQATNTSRPEPAAQTASASSSSAATSDTQTNQMPFRNFTAAATVGRLYLREIDISDFQAIAKIDGGHMLVNPCKLTLNGAHVNTTVDLDLGVPGYQYALSFNAQAVPLAPLVNSFQPERKGQLGGTFSAQAKLSGTGTSGASLQKSLSGQFDFGSTNLNLAVIDIKNPLLKTVVNVVAMIPGLVKNPEGAVGSLVQGLTGKTGGGFTDELSKSPINSILARGNAGAGRVDLQEAVIQSAAFRADATGTVTLAPVLTNSTIRMPVGVSLSQPIAQRLNLVPAGTPTNAPYAKLPDFLMLTGTVGNPEKQIDKMALLTLAAKGIGGSIPGVGGTAGNVVQGLSGLLGGKPAGSTNAPNATTNKQGGVLQGLGGILGGNAPATTSAPTNQPATNQAPRKNLLNDLLSPKQK